MDWDAPTCAHPGQCCSKRDKEAKEATLKLSLCQRVTEHSLRLSLPQEGVNCSV